MSAERKAGGKNIRYYIYAVVVVAAVAAIWLCTRGGPQQSPYGIPAEQVRWVSIYSSSMNKAVKVTEPEDIDDLTQTLNKLVPENGIEMEEEEIQLGQEFYRLKWHTNAGTDLAVVEIGQTGKVYREEYCYNYIGGEVFDIDRLAQLLFSLPESEES